jgi:hypothetical protein
MHLLQGWGFFLGPNTSKRGKYTIVPQSTSNGHTYIIPNDHKLYLKAVIYTKIFHSKALQKIPKLGFWVLK